MKQGNNVVLDSSAVLALILREPGGDEVAALLSALDSGAAVRVALSSVSWCEILTRLYRDSSTMTSQQLSALLTDLELIPLTKSEAELAADYSCAHPELSLGDRSCLALASARSATAWTTDRAWARAKIGVAVRILR